MSAKAPSASPRVRFGVFELDTQTCELRKSGHKIPLRPQASKILVMLVSRPGQLVTREELKEEVWGVETFVDFENGLNFTIRQIRSALSDDADSPRYIETLPRRGYRFIAPVDNGQAGAPTSRYRLLEKIGSGGMGEVYRAEDLHLGRELAIKVLPPGALADETSRKRFRKEAELLSKLNHPNIATVHDFETRDGRDYLVMENVQGVTLSEKLSVGPVAEKDVCRLGAQLADGVAAAHLQGVIHRDLKPGNIRITPDGWLKILDFGLARQTELASYNSTAGSSAQLGTAEGTLRYMAPEQLLGQALDTRTDVYGIGATLYEMATGRPPFDEKLTSSLIDNVLHRAPVPPRRLNSAVSTRLEDVILKCLEKDPGERYQSAKEIALDLRRITASSTTATFELPRRRASWRTVALVAAIAIAVAAVAAISVPSWRSRLSGGTAEPVRTVAVLPLQNLSGDASQEYFADGMTEALTTDLARRENLQVISRTSAMQFKDTKKPLPEIARQLHADAVIEGSVQRSGNKVRITAQLVRAKTDKHVWAQTYDRDLKDILSLEDEIASTIAQEIEQQMDGPKPVPVVHNARVSPEAYETYLKANYYLDQFELQKSIEYYNEAIKLDPNFAPSYAHMADAYFFLGFFGWMPPREAWGRLKDAALLAVQKDDRLPEGHGALAMGKLHYDWDFKGAEAEFKRALQLNPSDADIRHSYAHYLMAMGRVQESEAETQRGLELDPVGNGLESCLCWHSFAARDYDRSLALANKFLASEPHNFWERTILGWTYEQKNMPNEAIPQFKEAVEGTKGAPFFLAALGHGYAMAGNKKEAGRILETLLEKSKKGYVSPFDIALIYTAIGDKDKAFAWLDKAVDERSTFLVYSKWEPRLDPLRSDPRFSELLTRIGLTT